MLNMWRNVSLFTKTFSFLNVSRKPFLRQYLTSAFSCDEAWSKRLQSPYLKKVKVSDMFYEIENQFLHFGKANGLDIDLFANVVVDDVHLDEVEDVIHKLRLSPEAANLLPSTHHAFIRIMFSHGNIDDLLRILDDRLNYGIFMDHFCCILLLNKFLKEKDYKNATRIATIHMLQEDFSHPIIKYMSLFACHNYMLNPESWINDKSDSQAEQKNNYDEDEIKLRVRYIRNFYFDDHFDLTEPRLLVGKTLWMIGNEIPDILGRSYSLIGYALHEKWNTLKESINYILELKEEPIIFKEVISIIHDLVAKESNNKSEVKQKECLTEQKEEILTLLGKIKSNLISEESLLKITEDRMMVAIQDQEKNTIDQQIKIYGIWENERERLINEQLEKVKRDKTLAEIEAVKQKLKQEEEELFFFEKEDKLDVIIENKRVRYPKKWLGKKKQKRSLDQEYIPPEVQKRREN